MKVSEILSHVDGVEPNQFDAVTKIAWLKDLDSRVFEDLVLTHEHGELEWKAPEKLDDELLIPEPYALDCYEPYLRAKMAGSNMEAVRYNQHMVMYNTAYQVFANWYNRRYMPLSSKGGNRYKF